MPKNDWEEKVNEFTKAIFNASKDACDEGSKSVLERAKQLAPPTEKRLIESLNRWDITEAISGGNIPDMVEFIVGPDEEISRRGIDVEIGTDPQHPGNAFLLPALELSRNDIDEWFAAKVASVKNRQ